MRVLWSLLCLGVIGFAVWGCGEASLDRPIEEEGKVSLAIVVEEGAKKGVEEAAKELAVSLAAITGGAEPPYRKLPKGSDLSAFTEKMILLVGKGILREEPIAEGDSFALPPEGYAWLGKTLGGKRVFQIAATTTAGLQYGIYDLLRRWGVRFVHPGQIWRPSRKPSEITLPFGKRETSTPGFDLRGFHHHTQHPIPMAFYLLEPDPQNLPRVEEYLRWLAANRQNLLQWHMLKTVDLKTWLPYVRQIRDLAESYGITLGLTLSFADQQQNNFKLIEDLTASADAQDKAIQEGLDTLLGGGFGVLTLQFGTSEFTKVSDTQALRWLDTAAAHLKARKIRQYAWIHTEGKLKADDGKAYYFHLPERSDPAMGAYVHTTMFYDMKNPAPVYGNENFNHQYDFLKRIEGKRPIVYFPETAWWLGFDNNLPMGLPITGFSRALDILELLQGRKVEGHVTFTTGMEWGYWMYDHHLTRISWDRRTSWERYLDDISVVFGGDKGKIASVLQAWTKQQVSDFYGEHPTMIFYITGELPQDEIGQAAGILARRPKIPFREIYDASPEAFDTWAKGDLSRLKAMNTAYQALWQSFPKTGPTDGLTAKLFRELQATLEISVLRVQHALLLYEAVAASRQGRVDGGVGALPVELERQSALKLAQDKIDAAKAISKAVIARIAEVEGLYRYPVEILARKRPNRTSYPFGYLWETSTGFFWTRRDEQAERIYRKASGQEKDGWPAPPPALVFRVKASQLALKKPENPAIQGIVGSFIPAIMVALSSDGVPTGKITSSWRLGTDHNANEQPDPESVADLDDTEILEQSGQVSFSGGKALYTLLVFDKADNEIGRLGLQGMKLQLQIQRQGSSLQAVQRGLLTCEIELENLVGIATQVSGLERDGLLTLLGSLLNFDPKAPPRTLPLEIELKQFEKLP